MKRLYIETTIPSYATARASNDIIKTARQIVTRQFWDNERQKYNLYISDYVLEECTKGNPDAAQRRLLFLRGIELLPKTRAVETLAPIYQKLLDIPERARIDSFHLAIAVLYEMNYVVTWNFTHMGIESYAKLSRYNERVGYKTPLLVTPETLLGKLEV
jgi:hypothetical protein